MFYKVLFILTVIMFIRDINRYVKECRNCESSANEAVYEDISIGLYIKIGVSALFYIMVLTLALRPRLFWW